MKKSDAQKLINKTKQDYSDLTREFSATRAFPWQELRDLIQYAKSGCKILDAGCGNGRLFQLFRSKKIEYIGIDNCPSLIKEAKQKYPSAEFQVMDIMNLKFDEQSFDTIFCIAALQHIPSKEFRIQVLKSFHKILKPNGYLIMTNWNLWQKKYFSQSLKYSFSSLFGKHKELDIKDTYIPWKARFGQVDRYYHAFTPRELNNLLKIAGFEIEKSYYVKRGEETNWKIGHNLCTVAKKS